MRCKRTHHPSKELARKHLQAHNGTGYIGCCHCGRGWCTAAEKLGESWEQFEPTYQPPPPETRFRLGIEYLQGSCFRKSRYATEKDARRIIAKRNFEGRAYGCTACGGYHITKWVSKRKPPNVSEQGKGSTHESDNGT